MIPIPELADRLRRAVLPWLSGNSLEFVNEWIDDAGEYGIAIYECLAVAARHEVPLDPALLAEVKRQGIKTPALV